MIGTSYLTNPLPKLGFGNHKLHSYPPNRQPANYYFAGRSSEGLLYHLRHLRRHFVQQLNAVGYVNELPHWQDNYLLAAVRPGYWFCLARYLPTPASGFGLLDGAAVVVGIKVRARARRKINRPQATHTS